jgi:hypothetical protein
MSPVKILLSIFVISCTLDQAVFYGKYRQALFTHVQSDIHKAGYTLDQAAYKIVR